MSAPSSEPGVKPVAARKKKSGRWWLLGGVGLVVLLSVAVAVKQHNKPKETLVTTDKASVRTITQTVSATGKLQPEIEVKISPEVAGEIVELPVRAGSVVKKGDLLLRIKADNYEFQVDQRRADIAAANAGAINSKASLQKAKDDFRRSEDLYSKHLISEADYTAAKTQVEVAQANYDNALAQIDRAKGLLKQAQDQLDKTSIYAPMDGTISVLNSELGERVVATGQFNGTEVLHVSDLSHMEVRVSVNENDIINVKVGDTAKVSIDAFGDRVFKGEVYQISAAAKTTGAGSQDEVTNFEVRIRILDSDPAIRPGMSANADIETETVTNVVAVPIQAVTVRSREGAKTVDQLAADRSKQAAETKGEGSQTAVNKRAEKEREKADREALQRVVFLIDGNKVKQVPVETGIADKSYMEIKSGLKDGDQVVTGSFSVLTRTLKDGMVVRVDDHKKDSKDAPKTP